eukprot:CAMPEP_0197460892 /NCGR_PEP_ID=MMETSP1175-20131217/55110_1 /TAXON_ID=1003142 /ORGANISM="Triceratium dubium, Strain CCMP147" /LENGTH=61 /DNA_ID=CAMNT_0042996067 /DNA_START=121 /DNA_END=302 /DNA_ORIENTATION=+
MPALASVNSKAAQNVPRAGLDFALHMAEVEGVFFQDAPRVREESHSAHTMVEEGVATLQTA